MLRTKQPISVSVNYNPVPTVHWRPLNVRNHMIAENKQTAAKTKIIDVIKNVQIPDLKTQNQNDIEKRENIWIVESL